MSYKRDPARADLLSISAAVVLGTAIKSRFRGELCLLDTVRRQPVHNGPQPVHNGPQPGPGSPSPRPVPGLRRGAPFVGSGHVRAGCLCRGMNDSGAKTRIM